MGKNKSAEDIEQAVSDSREAFDLGDFLRGRSVRTKTVRVFTDEVTAEERGGYETYSEELPNGLYAPRVRSWGLVKDLAEAKDTYDALPSKTTKAAKDLKAKIDGIVAEIRALTDKLLDTALDIELRSVPDKIKKDAWRAARQHLGIRGKNGVTEDNAVELQDEQAAQILKRTVVSITKVRSEERNAGISLESARALKGLLPDSEWAKIDDAMSELLFRKVIDDRVASDLDF